jgi:hypothetical protein
MNRQRARAERRASSDSSKCFERNYGTTENRRALDLPGKEHMLIELRFVGDARRVSSVATIK